MSSSSEQTSFSWSSKLKSSAEATHRYFGITPENYPDLKQRTDALTGLYIAMCYAYAWFNYTFIYGIGFGSLKLGALCFFVGLPTALAAIWVLKTRRNVAMSSVFANLGGITTVLLVMIMTGGAWSHQIVWCIVAVLATFIVQTTKAGLYMTAYVGVSAGLIALFVRPGLEKSAYWDFPFAMLSAGHAYFNAITLLTGPVLAAACAYIFKSRQENALKESEALRSEAERARQRAEELTAQVQEHVRDIRSMLENTKIGLFSVTRDLSVHKDYARYLETIIEDKNIAGKSFVDLLLTHAELGPDEKNRIVTAIEYALGEDEILFEANASVLPKECIISLGGEKRKTLDIEWVPVTDETGNVEKILISLVDVSETLKLRAEAEEGRRSLRYLSELIELGPRRYEKFDHAARSTWAEIKSVIQQGEGRGSLESQDIRQIYVGLHTMKGVARMYKLSELTDKIHTAEESLNQKAQLIREEIKVLASQIGDIENTHDSYARAIEPIYALIEQARPAVQSFHQHSVQALMLDMQQMANELAKDLGKIRCPMHIELGEELIVKPEFYKVLSQAMVHIVRNSLDHGIEPPEERRAKGLAEFGSLRVFLDPQGHLAIQDDGRGLPLGKLRAKAAAMGRSQQTLSELIEMIFESGVSTKSVADDISGRGVGMDAVRSLLQAAGANIELIPLQEERDYLKFYLAITLPERVDLPTLKQAS